MAESTTFAIPSFQAVKDVIKKVIPQKKKKRKIPFVDTPENFADNRKLAAAFDQAAKRHFDRFVGQSSRTDLEKYLKDSDAKYRFAQAPARRFKQGSTQKQNTLSQVPQSQFYRSTRLIATAQKAIIFSDPTELPARYERIVESTDYSDKEGERIAQQQQLYLQYVWENDKWEEKIKRSIGFNTKNSLEMMSLEWEKTVETRPERLPGYYTKDGKPVEWDVLNPPAENVEMFDVDGGELISVFDDEGKPVSYVFIEKTRIQKNQPVLNRIDMRDAYFDLDIDGIQNQQALVFRFQASFGDLLQKQKDGLYKNVGRLSDAQLFRSETEHDSKVEEDRDENADQTKDQGENGLYDGFHVWMLASINPETMQWDPSAVPEIWEGVYAGQLGSYQEGKPTKDKKEAGAACLLLRKNPYHHGRFPYFLWHSLDDDKRGALNMGYYTILESNCEEQDITMNQLFTNKTLAIKAPWVAEKGNVLSRDLTFKDGNDVKWVKPGTGQTALTSLKIPNVTSQTVQEMAMLQEDADKTLGQLDAITGEIAGSRTTATEILGARQQARKPAIEDTKTMWYPFINWALGDVVDLSRQFASPDEVITVTGGNLILGTVNPSQLYGKLKIKVTSIDKFEADVAARQVIVNFIQAGGVEQSKEYMGPSGGLHFWRTAAKFLKLPEVNKIFP
ncbi:MAG: hypothetical protein JRL30_28515, partial [Deltaproteobacteria bacterium]|nr:hypothetical protein [Deltaproteobacteria bacterium]